MIFVTVGTVPIPFKRMINTAIQYCRLHPSEKIIIQSGPYQPDTPFPSNITLQPYFPFNQTIRLYRSADLIVSAAGEASVFLIIKLAKNIPVFIPRLKKLREHVDDQQTATCQYLINHRLALVAKSSQHLLRLLQVPLQPNPNRNIFNKTSKTSNHLLNRLDQLTSYK